MWNVLFHTNRPSVICYPLQEAFIFVATRQQMARNIFVYFAEALFIVNAHFEMLTSLAIFLLIR